MSAKCTTNWFSSQRTDRSINSYGETLMWEVHLRFTSFQDSSSEGATALSVPSSHGKATLRTTRLIQQAWIKAAGWDVPLPVHHQEQWRSWFQESTDLGGICIPRCLKKCLFTAVKASLHMFSDASEAAYATAVYICHEYEDQSTTTRLVGSKTYILSKRKTGF